MPTIGENAVGPEGDLLEKIFNSEYGEGQNSKRKTQLSEGQDSTGTYCRGTHVPFP